MSQSNRKAKQSPDQARITKAKASSDRHKNRVNNSNVNADSGKLSLQVATVAHAVKTIAQKYYKIEQSPQNPIDISPDVISGSALILMHVCWLFAIHYLIEHFKARSTVVKKYREAYRDIQDLSRQQAQLSARLKDSGGKR